MKTPMKQKEHLLHIGLSLLFFPWVMVWIFRIHQTQEMPENHPETH